MKTFSIIIVSVALFASSQSVIALTCADLPTEINRARTSASDETATLRLINRAPEGQISERQLFIKRKLANDNLSEKILVEVIKPAEIQGTKLLIHRIFGQKNKQWLYLPEFKKTKQVSEAQKSGNFLGSEFSFNDLTPFDLNDYECLDPILETADAYTIALRPRVSDPNVAKFIMTYDKTLRVPTRIESQNASGTLIKTVLFSDYHEIAPDAYRTFHVTMRTNATGRESDLKLLNLDMKTVLSDDDFSVQALSR